MSPPIPKVSFNYIMLEVYKRIDVRMQKQVQCKKKGIFSGPTLREVEKELKDNVSSNKAPGFELITGQIPKNLTQKLITEIITEIMNTAFLLRYVWKFDTKMKQNYIDKLHYFPSCQSYLRSWYSMPMKPIHTIEVSGTLSVHQSGFREKYSTIDQVYNHRITRQLCKTNNYVNYKKNNAFFLRIN